MSTENFFSEHPLFRYSEFQTWKHSQGVTKPNSIKSSLRYYTKIGRLKSLHREIYAVVPHNQLPDDFTVDPYLLAAKATSDAILAYHSALELLGSAYSSFRQITYLTSQKSKPFECDDHWYQPVVMPSVLKHKGVENLCIETINRQGVELSVTNPARTFVDILDRVDLSGGWEEVCRSLNHLVVLDVDELINYCLAHENARLNAKVGYFLSQRTGAFEIPQEILKQLEKSAPKSPQYLSKNVNEPVCFVRPWNIFLPQSVIHQSWEEPDVEVKI